jgi:hypothetical protein
MQCHLMDSSCDRGSQSRDFGGKYLEVSTWTVWVDFTLRQGYKMKTILSRAADKTKKRMVSDED